MLRRVAAVVLTSLLVASLPACKQGEGETCQIDDDCVSGLICNAGTRLCQKPSTAADAGPIDAATPDAAPVDAAP